MFFREQQLADPFEETGERHRIRESAARPPVVFMPIQIVDVAGPFRGAGSEAVGLLVDERLPEAPHELVGIAGEPPAAFVAPEWIVRLPGADVFHGRGGRRMLDADDLLPGTFRRFDERGDVENSR